MGREKLPRPVARFAGRSAPVEADAVAVVLVVPVIAGDAAGGELPGDPLP